MTAAAGPPPALDVASWLGLLAARGFQPALSFYVGKQVEGRLTYAELAARIGGLASLLSSELGVAAGERVAILAPNRLEIPVLVMALLRLGATVVPLNPAAAPEDWSYILAHCQARGLCTTSDLAAKVPLAARPAFVLPLEGLLTRSEAAASAPIPDADPALSEQVAVVLYTSGTTGNPKGVALRQRNLFSNAWSMAQNFELDATPQLAVLPLYHAHAFGFGLMTALLTGGHLVFTERLEPFSWATVVRAESIAVASVVPTLLPMLLAAGITHEQVPSLRALLVSSAPLSSALARDFEARTQIPLVQGWGLSEYTNFACCLPVAASAEEHAFLFFSQEVPSVGPALPGTEVRVDTGSTDIEGQRGELLIRGHSTMAGYLDDLEATARTIDAKGWLRTGDEGYFLQRDGRPIFFITGRLKEIIIRDAEKYSPLRLERVLLKAVPELAGLLVVLGFPHQTRGEEIGAYLQRESLDSALQARLEGAVAAMPLAERPKVILYGDEPIPRTHTGKIQRRKMQPWFQAWNNHRGPLVIAPRSRAAH